MELARKRIVVAGNVQGVGYRVLVKQIARALGVKGYVQNLEDGTVEVYAQAEPSVIDELIGKINVKSGKDDILSPSVDSITIFSESDKVFKPAKNAFRTFSVNHVEKLSAGEKEIIEKTEIGSLILNRMDSKFASFSGETKAFREETKGSFGSLDKKYGSVSGYLKKINSNLEELNSTIKQVVQKPAQ